jgi:hypothetical protein
VAKNNLGLGLVLTAVDKASPVFQKIGAKLKGLGGTASKIGAGLGKLGSAAKGAALGFAPFTLAMGFGLKSAGNFEQGMANVRTIMRDATEGEFTQMASKAKELGATTSFTAKQATEGMELLARSGFDASKTLSAIGPVLKAAEVEGIWPRQRSSSATTSTRSA